MKSDKIVIWKQKQAEFWETKPNATTTKEFFDTLAEGGWKCGACEIPRNPNPQRRIQDLKEFGYTIATDLTRYCPHCGKNTSQRILLPIMRGGNEGNGYETWTPAFRKRIIKVLGSIDVYEDTFGTVNSFSQKRLCQNEDLRRKARRGGCQAPPSCLTASMLL